VNIDVDAQLDALGDPLRRRIVSRLAAGPLAVSELAREMPVGRPAVSMHLRVLRSSGLVVSRPAGNRRLYQLNPDALARLRDHLDWYWTEALAAFAAAADKEVEAMADEAEIEVRKAVTVKVPLAVAFRVFLDQRWWPVATHHLAEPAGTQVVLEPFVGGRWFERGADGTESDWGRVLVFEPPHRLLISWQVSPQWNYEPDPAKASEIEVRFSASQPSETLVQLVHRHLERYGPAADKMRAILDGPSGAAQPLAAYARAAQRAAGP
jgi:DNA-binding transcriptional ArsR family regulator